MKKLFVVFLCVIMMSSCGNSKWEYKVVKISGEEVSEYQPCTFPDPSSALNNLGREGWELVSSYTETSSSFPNFGNSKYVTGLRENVHTTTLNFVFKRKVSDE